MQISPATVAQRPRPLKQESSGLPTQPPPKNDCGKSNGFVAGLKEVGDMVGGAVVTGGAFAFNELKELGKNDPALAMRVAATQISPTLLQGVDQPTVAAFGKFIVPAVRVGLLGCNIYRLNRTNELASSTFAEKSMDGLRVATDVVGLAGAVLRIAVPSWASAGDTMVGISYAADTVSHAMRGLTHGSQRIQVWNDMLDKAKKDKENPKQPTELPFLLADNQQSQVSAVKESAQSA